MRLFYDERIGEKRPVVRARPIRLDSGHRGMRVELKALEGYGATFNKPLIISEEDYRSKVTLSSQAA